MPQVPAIPCPLTRTLFILTILLPVGVASTSAAQLSPKRRHELRNEVSQHWPDTRLPTQRADHIGETTGPASRTYLLASHLRRRRETHSAATAAIMAGDATAEPSTSPSNPSSGSSRLVSGKHMAPRYMTALYKRVFHEEEGEESSVAIAMSGADEADENGTGEMNSLTTNYFAPEDFQRLRLYMESADTVTSFFPSAITQLKDTTWRLEFEFIGGTSSFDDTASSGGGTGGQLKLIAAELHLIPSFPSTTSTSHNNASVKGWSSTKRGDGESLSFLTKLGPRALNMTNTMASWMAPPSPTRSDQQQARQVVKIEVDEGGNEGVNSIEAAVSGKWHCFGVAFFKSVARVDENPSGNDVAEEPYAEHATNTSASDPTLDESSQSSGSSSVWVRRRKRQAASMNSYEEESDMEEENRTQRAQHSHQHDDEMSEDGEAGRNSSAECRVHPLYVSFRDLNWDEWIIAPNGFRADYCTGGCGFPLAAHLSPSNHAIVRSLLQLYDPTRADGARCAPVEMDSQRLLYLNAQQDVVMRKYPAMRVKRCGCL